MSRPNLPFLNSHKNLSSWSLLGGLGIAALTTMATVATMTACGGDKGSKGGDGGANNGSGGNGINVDGSGGATAAPNCGDGTLSSDEACDDGNKKDGDGCAATCLNVETGYVCPTPGKACQTYAVCGDGITTFPEQCDDGDKDAGDGCSELCKVEIGYKCEGTTCSATTCGDGVQEGAETCDDSNTLPFDGCDAKCQKEPSCTDSGCAQTCGDGLLMGTEACDDANTISGDGCSANCEVEEGYTCSNAGTGDKISIPVIYRDFADRTNSVTGHPDFQISCGAGSMNDLKKGIVSATLSSTGKPTLAYDQGNRVVTAANSCIKDDASFAQWYTDVNKKNVTFVNTIDLYSNNQGAYINRMLDGTQYTKDGTSYDGNPLFFPLDSLTNKTCDTSSATWDGSCVSAAWEWSTATVIPANIYGTGSEYAESPANKHNFHFTTEVTYWFKYDSSKTALLTFQGDDDVWVFVNRKLVVDLGGAHTPLQDTMTLSSTVQSTTVYPTAVAASTLGLTSGNVYEIKVFQAERKKSGSSFKLTLSGFDNSRSVCKSSCGDGIVGVGEQCDDGVNDGGYNECQPGCILASYCGDGVKDAGEDCDDGNKVETDSCPNSCRILVVK